MKSFFKSLFFSKQTMAVMTALCSLSVLFFYGCRNVFVFFDKTVFKGFAMLLLILMALDAVLLFTLLVLRSKGPKMYRRKAYKALSVISEILAGVFTVLIIAEYALGGDGSITALYLCREALPVWLSANLIALSLYLIPVMENIKLKRAFSIIITAVVLISVFSSVFPVTPYKLTSAPVVFDNGESYSVVFTTNGKGTGAVKLNVNGEEKIIYDENNGRLNADSIIHTVKVPYDMLSCNTYSVVSQRVTDELNYGGRKGKTVESQEIYFNDSLSDNVNALTVSDWHTNTKSALAAASRLGDYNAAIFLGDAASGLMSEKEVAVYIVQFCADITRGEMPALFVRGNHETRGRYASKLADDLGMDKFYYTAKLGNYSFIVLDSGEDKEDSHIEYGGMVNYENCRREMVNWLETLENTDNSKTVLLSHSSEICIEDELEQRAKAKLAQLNVSLIASGHEHKTEFFEENGIPVLIDGGINANGSGTYVASMLTLSPEGIIVRSVSDTDAVTINTRVLWK